MKLLLVTLVGLAVCCSAQNPFVVGGDPALPGEFPWQGSIRNFEDLHACGCVLVDSTHAVTAAHCQVGAGFNTDWGDVVNGGNDTVTVAVGAVVRHPDWGQPDPDGFSPNDVAVITLVSEVDGDNIEPVSLNRSRVSEDVGYVAGWGRQCANCSYSDTLHYTSLDVISDGLCGTFWGEDYNGEVHLCGFDSVDQEKATCSGDGGSGLVIDGESNTELHGIVSWGSSGCLPTLPSVFTRISQYVDWICLETDGAPVGC